ncbi:transcriptional regulator, partial [Pseudomonas brassicacearum subsp. neoaurantiaca]|nr:transcriptional regulator [Pseudomonas brassicacearum subsp. neoaurantiaca]
RREMAGRFGVSADIDVKPSGAIASELAPTMDLR